MAIGCSGKHVNNILLNSGETVFCGTLVNCSGPRAVETARMAGLNLPVEPRKRFTFVFDAETPLECDLPLTVDPSGVHVRSEGKYYLAGCPPNDDPAIEYDDFIQDHQIWQDKIWPIIATRIPQFEAIKVINSWVGHYAFNTLDQNAVIGPHHEIENFIFANGFSGHGLQQSMAMGRGISEIITYGAYRTIDLTPFAYSRIPEGNPFLEKAII